MSQTVEVSCSWCEKKFMARIADRKRGWAKCCNKACAASLREFGHNKAYWQARNPDNHLSAKGSSSLLRRESNIEKYARRLMDDDEHFGGFHDSGFGGHGQS